MPTSLDDPLPLHQLEFLPEDDTVTVERRDIDSYGVFPPDGAALLERLTKGLSPTAASEWYARAYGESVDMNEFVDTLDELGFVRHAADDDGASARPPRWQRAGRLAFSPAAWLLYA